MIRKSNMGQKKKKIKRVVPLMIMVFLFLFSTPLTTYADVISSSGSGSGSGSHGNGKVNDTHIGSSFGVPGPFIRWSSAYKGDVNWTTNITFSEKHGGQSIKCKASRWACVQKQVKGKPRYKNFRWIWWDRFLEPPGKLKKYGTPWANKNIADAEMQAELNRCAKWNSSKQLWYDNATGKKVDIVYKNGQQKTITNTIKTIVYAKGGGDPLMDDRRKENPKTLYERPTKEVPYRGKSGQTEMNHKKLIEAWFMPVTRTETYTTTNGTDKTNVKVTFTAGAIQYFSKNIYYNVKQPTIDRSWFKPFDLNRNGVALDEDVKRDYPDYIPGDPLMMEVDNKQGITDGRKLQTLDTNTSLPFSIKFKNEQLGFPTADEGGANLSQETPGSEFANGDGSYQGGVIDSIGSNSEFTTGEFYADNMEKQNVNGKISKDIAWNPNVKIDLDSSNASLTYNGTEKLGGEPFSFGLDWQGGNFNFKTTKIGEYHLFNNGRRWWEMSYEKGKFYGYGVEYEGIIKLDRGISNPTIINTNLYSKLASMNVVQPILRGVFEAKTVGGNIG